MSRKIVNKQDYLQFWKISSNTSFLEFDLAKSDLRLPSWPKVKFKEDFVNIFHFALPFFQALLKRWTNNKLKSHTSHIYFILYSTLLNSVQQNGLRPWWEQSLGNTLDLQSQNRAMTHAFRKIKSIREHARFCDL